LTVPLSILVFLLAWELASRAIGSPLILPSPEAVARWFLRHGGSPLFLRHLGASCLRALGASAVTLVLGTCLGLGAGLSPGFRSFTAFPLTVIRAVPVVSIILLAVFWLGSNLLPLFIAALMALPVMTDAVAAGIRNTPRRLVDAMGAYGFSRLRLLRHVYVPSCTPNFLGGLRSSFGLCWKVVAAGEVLTLPDYGAGTLLYSQKVRLETAGVFAVTVTLVVLCFVLEGVLSLPQGCLFRAKKAGGPRAAGTGRDFPAQGDSRVTEGVPLRVKGLRVRRGGRELFRDFSVDFAGGSVTAILAASGRGKTTLLDCVAGILTPDGGTILRGAEGQGDAPGGVSYLFQDGQLLPWRTVLQNVALPAARPGAIPRALAFLEKTGLSGRENAFPTELSGGERQRTALARAFCYPAPVLLMDEAFNSQDLPLKLALMDLTRSLLAQEPRTALLVTHDVREALCLADRILALTGEPLSIARDIPVPRSRAAPRSMADTYVRLPPELAPLEEDILDALGSG
jgi:ABC-type nitrate/sulfonate/bicarbonate transport system ATPase subunit/ABC-type nitrate/sulfonate/bicarbonate transport system permease component